jgi:hypothetical protein
MTAHKSMHSGRRWNDFVKKIGYVGSVKATEITYTPNGWHPHLHEIVFFAAVDGSKAAIESSLEPMRQMWRNSLVAVGADCDLEYGLNIKAAYGPVNEYVGKWSIVPELVRGAHKIGNEGSIVPFQLLDACADAPYTTQFERDLFLEYKAGVHGLHQLHPSPAYRTAMKVEKEPKDTETDTFLAKLDSSAWRHIIDNDLRAEMLIEIRRSTLTDWLSEHDIWQG